MLHAFWPIVQEKGCKTLIPSMPQSLALRRECGRLAGRGRVSGARAWRGWWSPRTVDAADTTERSGSMGKMLGRASGAGGAPQRPTVPPIDGCRGGPRAPLGNTRRRSGPGSVCGAWGAAGAVGAVRGERGQRRAGQGASFAGRSPRRLPCSFRTAGSLKLSALPGRPIPVPTQ